MNSIIESFFTKNILQINPENINYPYTTERTDEIYDIIIINNINTFIESLAELLTSKKNKNKDTIIIYNNSLKKSWDIMKNNNYIFELGKNNLISWGKHNFDNLYPTVYLFYKGINRQDLYNNIAQFYHKNEYKILVDLSNYYLELFGDLTDKITNLVKFFNASGYSHFNEELAIESYEKILMIKDLESEIRIWSEHNLLKLYTIDTQPIPKIIHLLYFGETEFHEYQYHCIKSVLKNMPSYQVIIYNNKEPVGNKFWDRLKKKQGLIFKNVDVPLDFDDYDLGYFQYKADVVRMQLLYEHGGIYLDLDMLILKNFEKLFENNKSLYLSKEGEGPGLINAFIACKPKNEFIKIWLNAYKSGLRMGVWAYHIRDTNRLLIEKYPYYIQKYQIDILDSKYFFSIPWCHSGTFANLKHHQFNEDNYGLHLFETILTPQIVNNPYLQDKLEDFPILAISLHERPERQEYIKEQLKNYNYELLLNNINKESTILGCTLSHIRAIEYAKEKNYDAVLIVEDDIKINSLAIEEFPDDWDVLYFGGILTHTYYKKGSWIRGIIWCNHAYILKKHMYDVVLNKFKEMDLENMKVNKQCIDWFFTTYINQNYNCYLAEEQYIVQKEGYSELDNKVKWANFNWATYAMKYL